MNTSNTLTVLAVVACGLLGAGCSGADDAWGSSGGDDEQTYDTGTDASEEALSATANAASSSSLVVQRGMMGVNMGMTTGQVRERLGKPDGVSRGPDWRSYRYGKTRFFFGRDGGVYTVVNINTQSRRPRTQSGVGVGSSRASVMLHVRGAHCSRGVCSVGPNATGTFTDFSLERDIVTSVNIGLRSD